MVLCSLSDEKFKIPLLERLTQRRTPDSVPDGGLNRCLGIFDLVNSGFSIVVGAGIFVITPVLTANTTGPAVTVSYLIAGLAALVSALTYAELAARFAGIGSAYLYVYYVLGELAAGVIGISMIIEWMIGLASLIKSLSIYTDQLILNGTIIAWESNNLALHVPYMTKYVDLFALLILLLCGALNMWGVKETVVVSAICNVVVLVSLVLVIIMGFLKGSTDNWLHAVPEDPDFGSGGYFPYGFAGVFTGASLAYFSYSGFDAIACLGCEARNPQKDIPISMVLTFGLIMTLYILVCGAITFVAPYYTLNHEAGMALAFASVPWVCKVIALGAILATATGSFASILSTSRVVFGMAQDGIVYRKLTHVSSTQVPILAIMISMVLPALGIIFLDIEELVMMNSGGSLICFCLTNVCVIVGRYQPAHTESHGLYTSAEKRSILATFSFWACSIAACACLKHVGFTVAGITTAIIIQIIGFLILCLMRIKLKEAGAPSSFKCPLVPWLPAAGIVVNSSLMVSLPLMTWARVGVCTGLGLSSYATYGIYYSNITLAKIRGENNETYSGETERIPMSNINSTEYTDTDKLVDNEF